MLSKILIMIALVQLAGCVTPEVTTQRLANSTVKTDFGQYKTINYTLARAPTAEIEPGFGDEEISLFDTLLQKKLVAMGYSMVDQGAADFGLLVTITAAKPGNSAARFWVGFGAGRGVFTFDAKFMDKAQHELASFAGGQAYTGLEHGAGLSSEATIMATATASAVSQIDVFMRNGGSFPQKSAKR